MAMTMQERRARRRRRDQGNNWVYRLYDVDGDLLYVGCTEDVERRLREHHSKPWFPLVDHVEADIYDGRASAAHAELRLIHEHQPPYNVQGVCRAKSA